MYIIGAAFLIGLGGLGRFLGQYLYGVVGLISLLIISAVATGIIVYTNLSTPLEYNDYNAATKKGFESLDSKHSRLLEGYRVSILEKHLVFYKVNDEDKTVIIYAVVDGRREYKNLI
ncbi:MAG: type II toxin-antitoxin system RelE/ParE family toxin [Tissierellia bacterium]|nr:type II toxin-antitoxin system RelE/ParE family toxin [Tissierellia bacterium]